MSDDYPPLEVLETFGIVHDPPLDDVLDDLERVRSVERHIAPVDDATSAVCDAELDPRADTFPFRGRRFEIVAGLDSSRYCEDCVAELMTAAIRVDD